MTVAPVRLAMAAVSPTWSACPWETRMKWGFSSSGLRAAVGLPVRKGSMRTECEPVSRSRLAWPSQQTRVAMVDLLLGERGKRADRSNQAGAGSADKGKVGQRVVGQVSNL